MKYNRRFCLILIFLIICLIFYIIYQTDAKEDIINIIHDRGKSNLIRNNSHNTSGLKDSTIITVAVVACGQRLQETLTMIKSAILFNVNGPPLKFVLIADDNLHNGFHEKLSDWQEIVPHNFTYEILKLQFPKRNEKEWKSLFKPCAAQRLFLPSLLNTTDSVLYLDTDTVFLSPVSEIWGHFKNFNASQIAGLSPEHEDRNSGWYNRFARHPFYGPLGVNSGVMLMNLTRMREFQWQDRILPIHDKYKLKITWGDQDLLNILFHFHPDKLYVFPCEYNYRPDHCMYISVCNASNGIQIMHGNRGYFHSNKQPAFSVVYNSIESYQLGKDPYRNFLLNLDSMLSETNVVNSNCGKVKDIILMKAKKIFTDKDYYYNR